MTVKEFYEKNPEEKQFGELNLPGNKQEPSSNSFKEFISKIIIYFVKPKKSGNK